MVQVEFNEFNNYLFIYLFIYKNINNVTTFLNRKISCKMTMPHKLVWMDEIFI